MSFTIRDALSAVALIILSAQSSAQIGTPLSTTSIVNSTAAGDTGADYSPEIVTDENGTWTCVFESNDVALTNGGDTDIFWTRSRDLGVTWSAAQPITSAFTTDSGNSASDIQPALAAAGQNRMLVWASTRNSSAGWFGIQSAFSTSSATTWSNAQAVNLAFATDSVNDLAPCVAGGGGTFVTVWQRTESPNDFDLWFSRTTSNGGATWSTPARVDVNSATDSGPESDARLATDGAGHWVLVFDSNSNLLGTGADHEICYYRSLDDGLTWFGPGIVNTSAGLDGSADDFTPSICVDRNSGAWMCTWTTKHTFGGTTGGDAEIACAVSLDNGLNWSPSAIVNNDFASDSAGPNNDLLPNVCTDSLGHFVVTWARRLGVPSELDIVAARSDDLGAAWTSPQFVNISGATDSGTDTRPRLATDRSGHWICAWHSTESVQASGGDGDVSCARFLVAAADSSADFCYGYVESGIPSRCPCGNDSSMLGRAGCANSGGSGGRVFTTHALSASAPHESISFSGLTSASSVLMFQGTAQVQVGAGSVFGDGLLCVGGTLSRLGVAFANAAGSGQLQFFPQGVSAGSTRFHQGWYRDSASFCTSATFNLTNAFATVWQP